MATLTSLIASTRLLLGDIVHEGNTRSYEDEDITAALNWAQNRYAELTKCTYVETDVTSTAGGKVTTPTSCISVERVIFPDIPIWDFELTYPLDGFVWSSVGAGNRLAGTVTYSEDVTITSFVTCYVDGVFAESSGPNEHTAYPNGIFQIQEDGSWGWSEDGAAWGLGGVMTVTVTATSGTHTKTIVVHGTIGE